MPDLSNAAPRATLTPPTPTTARDSIKASSAGWLGAGLIAVGLVAFVATLEVTSSSAPTSLAFAAMSGVALLSLTLVGIMVLTRAIGMTDATQALGLPQGSVRALLAFALAIVFVSVASWTLGGLFDPMGPLVAKDTGAADKVADFVKPYSGNDRYILFQTAPDKDGNIFATVYLKREAPEKDVLDLAKQIVTISATVLVTIVGFYFGSKSSSDAAKSVSDTLAAARRADAADAQDATPAAPEKAPATADDIAKAANAVKALAASTATKLQSLGPAPMDLLRNAVAQGKGGDAAKTALASAEASFVTLSDRAKTCADAGARAARSVDSAKGADQPTLNRDYGDLQTLANSATQANHDFEQAFAAFGDARQKVLAATAR